MKYPVLLGAAIFLFACGDKKPADTQSAAPVKDTAATPKQFFPVMEFIKGEISAVDSLPVGIKKYTGSDEQKFVYIKPDEFHRLAAAFTPAEISDSIFQNNFKETSFLDRSSNSATFFYSAKNDNSPVRRVHVLTVKGDVYDQVKSIYLQKNYRSGDTAISQKLYWKPKQRFQIITETTAGSAPPQSTVVNVVWDNREEE